MGCKRTLLVSLWATQKASGAHSPCQQRSDANLNTRPTAGAQKKTVNCSARLHKHRMANTQVSTCPGVQGRPFHLQQCTAGSACCTAGRWTEPALQALGPAHVTPAGSKPPYLSRHCNSQAVTNSSITRRSAFPAENPGSCPSPTCEDCLAWPGRWVLQAPRPAHFQRPFSKPPHLRQPRRPHKKSKNAVQHPHHSQYHAGMMLFHTLAATQLASR